MGEDVSRKFSSFLLSPFFLPLLLLIHLQIKTTDLDLCLARQYINGGGKVGVKNQNIKIKISKYRWISKWNKNYQNYQKKKTWVSGTLKISEYRKEKSQIRTPYQLIIMIYLLQLMSTGGSSIFKIIVRNSVQVYVMVWIIKKTSSRKEKLMLSEQTAIQPPLTYIHFSENDE